MCYPSITLNYPIDYAFSLPYLVVIASESESEGELPLPSSFLVFL